MIKGQCLHITKGSQRFEPFQDGRIFPPRSRASLSRRFRLFDRLPFHLEVHSRVSVGRIDIGMAQPLADRDEVGSRLEQVNSGAVPHAVRVESFGGQRRLLRCGAATVFGEDIADSKPRQWSAAVIAKERFTIVGRNLSFRKEGFDELSGLWPKGTETFFASLSEKSYMKRPLQLEIAWLDIDGLLNTGARIKHHDQENVIAPAIG